MLALASIGIAASAIVLLRTISDNRTIAALADGHEVEATDDASDPVLFAHAHFLLVRDRFDEARSVVERIAQRGDTTFAIAALYDKGNAHLRKAFEIVGAGKYDETIAQVNLAKEHYLRTLRLDPQNWDAKFNLDVAMRLVRDFPDGEAEGDEDQPEQPDRLWTDLPGLPRGGP